MNEHHFHRDSFIHTVCSDPSWLFMLVFDFDKNKRAWMISTWPRQDGVVVVCKQNNNGQCNGCSDVSWMDNKTAMYPIHVCERVLVLRNITFHIHPLLLFGRSDSKSAIRNPYIDGDYLSQILHRNDAI